ncbi:ribosomal protein L4/L1e [Desulfarculus baarsii DSM 2075]|uniref:Large ribosomal subunit protein uL4 n=1 Tax=Desulfarculus baarsii (strain ATCC 33931 / DSM 2075 / LMG 7858 / VKM B-1802 / 2st14) TaxID=644282 RepID=E1QKT1_DESB2|nr:50S ribosomal protein L4 [Desulfarculus baarsii]ADK86290.1 ribosomal protein L4/L1e [Desulfarculus baarsii DSM 2075]
MPKVDVYDEKKQKVGEIELADEVFAAEVKAHLLHEVVVWQLAKRRAGTACTKTRSEVRGGGRKPWRQKGTGRARVGSRRSPLWRGGGTTHGPKPRDYDYNVPKKVRKAALKSALSDKLAEEKLMVLRGFGLEAIKTKAFAEVLATFQTQNVLVVTAGPDEVLEKSARNIPMVKVLRAEGLNVYDILRYDRLMLLEPAVGRIEEALS